MRARVLAVVAVVAASLVLPSLPAGAGTTVKVNGNTVKITVPVHCVGCKDWVDPINGGSLAKYWEKTAEAAWNEAFSKFSYCNKYKLELDIKMKNVAADAAADFGSHRLIATTPDGRGFTGAGWGGAPEELTPGGPADQVSTDGTRYYEFDAEGTMPADATPTVIAHEFGHVIGLGDDRDASGNALPGRDKTLMVGGAEGVTPNTKLRIDKALIDRIGDQLANLDEISCGETWQGSITGTGENVGVCPQNIDFDGEFTIRVRPDDSAALNGHFGNVNNGACGGGGESFETDFRLDGTKTRRALRLTESAVFPWPVNLRISGDRATGNISKMFGPVYLTKLEFTARRVDQERAAS